MTHAEKVIKKSIKDFKLEQSRARRKKVEEHLNYYTGTDTDKYIKQYFSADTYQEIPNYTINITKKLVDKNSRLYVMNPIRHVGGKIQTRKYEQLTPYKNLRFKHLDKMSTLLGVVACRIFWNDADEDNPILDHRPIYYFDAQFGSDPYNPTSIIYPILAPTCDVSYADPTGFMYWDDEVAIEYDENGNVFEEWEHGYGVLPFAFKRDIEQIDDFYGEGASDIISINRHVDITMTEMQLGLRFQMFGQPWASGVYEDEPVSRVGSDTIINLPEGGRFGIESPKGDLSKVIDSVKFQVEMLAKSRHMNVEFDSNKDRPSSGLALVIKDFESLEAYQDSVEIGNVFEKQVYKIEKVIAGMYGVQLPKDMNVEFVEPAYPKSAQEQISLDEWRLARGHITDAEIIKRDRKDISIEEAQKILDENKKQTEEPQAEEPNEEVEESEDNG